MLCWQLCGLASDAAAAVGRGAVKLVWHVVAAVIVAGEYVKLIAVVHHYH